MGDDQTFRMALLAGLLVLIPVAIYRRVKSQATREKLDRRQEGLFILLALRLFGVVTWVGLIAYLVRPGSMAWASVALPNGLRWIGVGLGWLALALLVWTLGSLGRNLTDTVVTRKQHTLVTNGPYRWVRHPFYCSAALLVLGSSLAAANWFLLLTGGLVFLLLVIRTRIEEQHLLARFGDEYRQYRDSTGRFWPRHFGQG
jgi:protein-S-isoprenylcysteine O-methyltransferase Ste14